MSESERRPLRVLVWQWGRGRAGPRYTFEVVRALFGNPALQLHLSLSRQSDLFGAFASFGLPGFHVDTYEGGVLSAVWSSRRLFALRSEFEQYLRSERIDVVYCTMTHWWNLPLLAAIRSARVPYLFTVHDAAVHPGERLQVLQSIQRREIRAADGVIALTAYVRDQAMRTHGSPDIPSWLVPHGSLYGSAVGVPRRLAPGKTVRLLFFGRILAYKGIDTLLEAFEILLRRRLDFHLSILGEGKLPQIPRAIGATQIEVRNRWIRDDEVAAAFADADVLVLPYREASQSGVAPIAFAAGVPVVATPVGGLTEQIEHLSTGIIASSASPLALADAIVQLANQPGLYEWCSSQGLRLARLELDWSQTAAKLIEAIRATAARGSRPVDSPLP